MPLDQTNADDGLLLATAADGRLWQASHTAMAASFDPSPYRTVTGRAEPGR